MNGIFLMLALFLELTAVISLKLSQGFSKLLLSLAMVVYPPLACEHLRINTTPPLNLSIFLAWKTAALL